MNKTVRLSAVVAAVVASLLLSGCGISNRKTFSGVTQDQLSAGQEPYFNVGGVTYQVQESRQLNPFSDDVDYFTGLKGAQSIPGADFWYGVFLWAKNQSTTSKLSANPNAMVLTDSEGNSYHPVKLPPVNPFAWTQQTLAQNAIEPDPDSIAAAGDTAGGLILFELPQSDYQNRPLTLHIYAPGTTTHASAVDLDL